MREGSVLREIKSVVSPKKHVNSFSLFGIVIWNIYQNREITYDCRNKPTNERNVGKPYKEWSEEGVEFLIALILSTLGTVSIITAITLSQFNIHNIITVRPDIITALALGGAIVGLLGFGWCSAFERKEDKYNPNFSILYGFRNTLILGITTLCISYGAMLWGVARNHFPNMPILEQCGLTFGFSAIPAIFFGCLLMFMGSRFENKDPQEELFYQKVAAGVFCSTLLAPGLSMLITESMKGSQITEMWVNTEVFVCFFLAVGIAVGVTYFAGKALKNEEIKEKAR